MIAFKHIASFMEYLELKYVSTGWWGEDGFVLWKPEEKDTVHIISPEELEELYQEWIESKGKTYD